MIEAKDLRVGNYVKYEGYECYREINEISKHCIKYHDSMLMPYCEAPDKPVIVGIPLTEEWLVKFGFDDNFHKGKFWVCLDDDGYFYTNHNLNDEGFTEVLHVHQLQNLYFALTNEELTIKK